MNKTTRFAILVFCLYYLAGMVFLFFYYSGRIAGTFFTQPFFMPLLVLYYFLRIKTEKIKPDKWLLIAIFFSWLGDLSMMFCPVYVTMVLPGIIAFLLMHLTYIKMFSESGAWKRLASIRILPVLLFFAAGIALYSYLFPYFTDKIALFKLPVLIYTCVIVTMVIVAVLRNSEKRLSYFLVFAGALVFMLSDSTLSIHVFKGAYWPVVLFSKTFYLSYAVVGFTYTTAQLLIVEGLIRSKKT